MYFISKTSKIYHFFAHISPVRRYLYTALVLLGCIVGWIVIVYYPCLSYEAVYEKHYNIMQKTYADGIERASLYEREVTTNDALKNEMQSFISELDYHEYCKEQSLWIMNVIKNNGLILVSYTVSKETEEKWYKKERVHYVIEGLFNNILSFIDTIKKSQKMITLSHCMITRLNDSRYQLSLEMSNFFIIK